MKYKSIIILVALLTACTHSPHGTVAYRLPEKDLVPEGIAYSQTTNSFYVSSIYKQKIVRVDAATGECTDFYNSDDLRLQYLGMMVDDARGHLWACGNAGQDSSHISAIVLFKLETGELLYAHKLESSTGHLFNDLVLDQAGNVYYTDTNSSSVFMFDVETGQASPVVQGKSIAYPNGITISPDDKYLYIASNDMGIRVLDLVTRKIVNRPDTTYSIGLDGMKYYQHSIVAIQNNLGRDEWKVVQYPLSENGAGINGANIIDRDNPLFDIPTTCVIVDDAVYWLANSQMDHMEWDTGEIQDTDSLNEPLILKKELK